MSKLIRETQLDELDIKEDNFIPVKRKKVKKFKELEDVNKKPFKNKLK